MAADFDVNELVLTVIDQAHTIRRLSTELDGLTRRNAELEGRLADHEAKGVADEIMAEAPKK